MPVRIWIDAKARASVTYRFCGVEAIPHICTIHVGNPFPNECLSTSENRGSISIRSREQRQYASHVVVNASVIVIAVLPRQVRGFRIKGVCSPRRTKNVNGGVCLDTVPQLTTVRVLTFGNRSSLYTVIVSSNDDKRPYVLPAVTVQA